MADMPQAAAPQKLLHIFKPGRWTTVAGEALEFSEADLAASAAAYDPKLHKAPIVKGHPAIDAPAQGWAEKLTHGERGLYAQPTKVDPVFAEEARAGKWGAVSAKFYRPDAANNPVPGVWYLRHIGVLGAHPPSVKGLDDPEFSEVEDGCVCFAEGVAFGEWDAMTSANLLRNLREWFVSKFGLDEADRVLPNYDVRALELGAHEELNASREGAGRSAFAEGDASNPPSQPNQESTVNEQEAAQLRDQNAALKRQNDELALAASQRAALAVQESNAAFAEGLVRETRIPAAMKDQVAAIGAQLQSTPDVEFGEGDAKKPLHELFRDLLNALPPQVAFGEQATTGRAHSETDVSDGVAFAEGAAPDRAALDKRIRAYAKEHSVNYTAAAHAVMRKSN